VLVALADAAGTVLTREDLLRLCWDNRIVGDDAINRAVAEVRRTTAMVGASFEVETVPRIGYRLIGVDWASAAETEAQPERSRALNRRNVIAAGAAALVLSAGGGFAFVDYRRSREMDQLIQRGRDLRSSGLPDGSARAEAMFRKVIARDGERADAWGWLAVVSNDGTQAREAALRALALDPREPNARTIMAVQRRDLDAWTRWEDELLAVLDDDPDCVAALSHLTSFYQGMGRCRDSWATNERAIKIEPLNPSHMHRRALKLWLFDRVREADQVANKSLQLWPRNANVWNTRLLIYAFTDRAAAAMAMLDDVSNRPGKLTSASVDSWRAALQAIATRAPADVDDALKVCTAAARLAPGLAANAIMTFSYLGKLDAAYDVAAGLFEGRGAVVQQSHGKGINDVYSNTNWGRTQFLFIPAAKNFRADSRFPEICQRLGHVAYWRRRNIWPDPLVRGALNPSKLA
jgi:tetratricopeptide (TPR) repeat protein